MTIDEYFRQTPDQRIAELESLRNRLRVHLLKPIRSHEHQDQKLIIELNRLIDANKRENRNEPTLTQNQNDIRTKVEQRLKIEVPTYYEAVTKQKK